MRFESCKKCGAELRVSKRCDVCREPSQFYCHKCRYVTDEQTHLACNKSIESAIKTGIVV